MPYLYLKQWQQAPDGETSSTPNESTPLTVDSQEARTAQIKADSDNEADILIGPDATASFWPLSPGDIYQIPMLEEFKIDLADWHVKSESASQGYKIIYLL